MSERGTLTAELVSKGEHGLWHHFKHKPRLLTATTSPNGRVRSLLFLSFDAVSGWSIPGVLTSLQEPTMKQTLLHWSLPAPPPPPILKTRNFLLCLCKGSYMYGKRDHTCTARGEQSNEVDLSRQLLGHRALPPWCGKASLKRPSPTLCAVNHVFP